MAAIGKYLLRGRFQAIACISLLSALAPILSYPAGVVVALLTLRRGGLIGLQVIAGGYLVIWLLTALQLVIPNYLVLLWLPVWICAMTLRLTSSQGLMVLAAGILGVGFLVFLYLYMGDVSAWWRAWLETRLQTDFPPETQAQIRELFNASLPMINAKLVALFIALVVGILLLARWWQSRLFNPGGFRREFVTLRLPRALIYPTLVGIVLTLIGAGGEQSLPRDLLFVLFFLYVFQGVSAVHRVVRQRRLSSGWLVALYALLLFLYPVVSCIGLVDSWMAGKKTPAGR